MLGSCFARIWMTRRVRELTRRSGPMVTVNLVVAMLLVVMFFLSIRDGRPSPEYLLYAAAVFTGGVTVAGFGSAIESLRRIRVAIERMS